MVFGIPVAFSGIESDLWFTERREASLSDMSTRERGETQTVVN